jgi:hypothetical protein
VVQKKKLSEFEATVNNPLAKILILTGPPGCAKNTMLDVYSMKHSEVQLVRFVDTKGLNIPDIYAENGTFSGTTDPYPDDLENLLYFIRSKYA